MTYKYTKEQLEEAVSNSVSLTGTLRYLGRRPAGGSITYLKRRLTADGISTEHFTGQGHMRGKLSNRRLDASEILVVLPEGSRRTSAEKLRRALIESGIREKCVGCGITNVWNGKFIRLHVDHIDGNWYNNLIDNLRFFCPNCHSQEEETNRPWKRNKK